MKKIGIIGIDLAKNIFQLHGACPDGSVAFRKRVARKKLLSVLEKQPHCPEVDVAWTPGRKTRARSGGADWRHDPAHHNNAPSGGRMASASIRHSRPQRMGYTPP